jgi:CBS domain-containing protein
VLRNRIKNKKLYYEKRQTELKTMDADSYTPKAIRRKLESDLQKKKHLQGRTRHSRKAPPGTVLALKPSPALQIKPSTTVAEAAQLMAAKREDCVLVTDDDDRITGIFTAKDLAFRVVGGGLKANNVTIAEIMTKNPLCARTDTSATDALDLMVRKGFRHLPVMDENQDISGVLDITKCFYDAMEKLERAYASSRKLYDALEGVQSELGTTQPQQIIQYVEALRLKMSGPTLESVLTGMPPTTVSVRTSVKEAAQLMKENHTTAVLVQDQGAITGIFTSKDVVLRVIAPGLDPANCSVVRVMTPHPDFAPMDMSIQAALRKMHGVYPGCRYAAAARLMPDFRWPLPQPSRDERGWRDRRYGRRIEADLRDLGANQLHVEQRRRRACMEQVLALARPRDRICVFGRWISPPLSCRPSATHVPYYQPE